VKGERSQNRTSFRRWGTERNDEWPDYKPAKGSIPQQERMFIVSAWEPLIGARTDYATPRHFPVLTIGAVPGFPRTLT
jgi:hypothetical protein